jgi:hypothetical protein
MAVRTAASPGSGVVDEPADEGDAEGEAVVLVEFPQPAATRATAAENAERVAIVRVLLMNSGDPHVVVGPAGRPVFQK